MELYGNYSNMTIVTPSVWLSGLVKESFLKNLQVEIINNGIDLNVFKPTFGKYFDKFNIANKKDYSRSFIYMGTFKRYLRFL